jgi:hypothetical protein
MSSEFQQTKRPSVNIEFTSRQLLLLQPLFVKLQRLDGTAALLAQVFKDGAKVTLMNRAEVEHIQAAFGTTGRSRTSSRDEQ